MTDAIQAAAWRIVKLADGGLDGTVALEDAAKVARAHLGMLAYKSSELSRLRAAANAALLEALEGTEDALRRIKQWADAYPEKVFTPLADGQIERAGRLLAAAGISMDALHAGWARHIVGGIGDIARAALALALARKEWT